MNEKKEIELVVHTSNDEVTRNIEESLGGDVTITRVPATRVLDVVSILVTATAAVRLLTALLELRKKWKEIQSAPKIEVTNEKGDVIDLLESPEEMIRKFIDLL